MAFKQKLVLFENILNSADIMLNQPFMSEIDKLVKYVFEEAKILIDNTEKDEELQLWCGKVLNKTISHGYGQSYTFKSQCEISGDDFSGPIKGWLLEPEGAFEDSIIVLTCESNGLIKNPRYVCGLVMNVRDIETQLQEL